MKVTYKMGLLAILLFLLVGFIGLIAWRTFTYPFVHKPAAVSSVTASISVSEDALRRLAGGIRVPTISNTDYDQTNFEAFRQFGAYLAQSYPTLYEKFETHTINGYGLVFRWVGKNSTLKPLLFLSHYDVVPVVGYEDATRDTLVGSEIFQPQSPFSGPLNSYQTEWQYPPFSGAIANGRVYGRGTLDMKSMLFALMEAAEMLVQEGFQPEQDIWFAFGQDEEVGGKQGAVHIADFFKEKNIQFDGVFDEGGFITAAGVGGIDRPVALVGTAEKGFLTLQLRVFGIGGHSSTPPAKSTLVMAAEIIQKLNEHQMPLRLIEPVSSFLDHTGKEMSFVSRVAIANKWLFKGVLLNQLSQTPSTNALVRTTTAVTMAKGSDAPNVLSSVSEVVVNFRILPGDDVATVIDHVKTLCEGYEVEIEVLQAREPSNISPADSKSLAAMKNALSDLYPDAIVATYITVGGTDARKYEMVSDHVYRLMPIMLNDFEQRTIHNENESISIENYGRMIRYFTELMRNYEKSPQP